MTKKHQPLYKRPLEMYPNDPSTLKRTLKSQYTQDITEEDPYFQYLVTSKLSANLDYIRKSIVTEQLNNKARDKNYLKQYQDEFMGLENETVYILNNSTKAITTDYNNWTRSVKTRRYSIDFDSSSEVGLEEIEEGGNEKGNMKELLSGHSSAEEKSIAQLRKRLLGKRKGSVSLDADGSSIDKQMQVQDDLQQNLIQDISQLVTGLRQGAEAFQRALNEDSTVLQATEVGLQATSRNLSTLGGKLKKYHNSKFGFLFYIGCVLFMIFGLLITYLIVKIFPKM